MSAEYQTSKKVLVYCRESRDDYGEKYERIETQRDILLDFCKKNGLTNIVDIIMDDNVTGTSFKRLDEIKHMMQDGKIEIFICKDASRLGRNLLESLKFIEFAENHDVRIIFESEEFNPELFPLIAWFNERRAKDDSDKIRRVLRHKLENGLVIVPPYGYKKERGGMVPDSDTCQIVKKIFEMSYEGGTPAQISDYLNILQAPGPSVSHSTNRKNVNPIWTRDNVRRILKNPVYTGTQIAGKVEKVSYKSKKYRRVPEEQRIVIHNHHEALVSQEVFDSIQNRLRSFKVPSRNPSFNPFSGLMYCGRCGKSIILRGKKGNMPVKYICAKHNREGDIKDNLRPNWGCSSHAVYYDDIKNIIMDYISRLMRDDNFKQAVFEEFNSLSKNNDLERMLSNMCDKEKKLQKNFDVLYEDKLNGLLPEFMFSEKSKPITDEIQKLRNQIGVLKNEIKNRDSQAPPEQYERCVKLLYENGLTSEGISQIFERIIVYEEHEITESDKQIYNIKEEQYTELYNKGGLLFIQKIPFDTLTVSHI